MESVETICDPDRDSFDELESVSRITHRTPIAELTTVSWSISANPHTVIGRNFILEETLTQSTLMAYEKPLHGIVPIWCEGPRTVYVSVHRYTHHVDDAIIQALERDGTISGIVRLSNFIRFALAKQIIKTAQEDQMITLPWIHAKRIVSGLVYKTRTKQKYRGFKTEKTKRKPSPSSRPRSAPPSESPA